MTVIADAVYAKPAERDALEAVARDARVPFHGIWLDAPLNLRIERVAARRDDASDATAGFLRTHPRRERGLIHWLRIDASGGAKTTVAAVLESLEATVEPA
jgi:predicted kinase